MKRKKIIADYFSFTRKDRIAIVMIILLICFVFFFPLLFKNKSPIGRSENDTAWIAAVKKLEITAAKKDSAENDINDNSYNSYLYDRSKSVYESVSGNELFYFDPNTASFVEWKKLGIKDKTAKTILNYLSKGGRFNNPEDLKKIYGLHPDEYERLAPYIRIKESSAKESNYAETKYTPGKPAPLIVEINKADTSAFISLPGIGSKLAARIVNFREKLGGFYSVEQIKETYGLPDSTFQKIKQYLKLESPGIKKININTATVDELKAHPYIRYNIANPIIAYRNQHGLFKSIEDIKKVMVVTDEVYNKIAAYLTVQ